MRYRNPCEPLLEQRLVCWSESSANSTSLPTVGRLGVEMGWEEGVKKGWEGQERMGDQMGWEGRTRERVRKAGVEKEWVMRWGGGVGRERS